MRRAKALKVKLQDRAGVLGDIASALGAKGVNVRGMHGYVEQGQGILCLVVDKLATANKVLLARGFRPQEEEVLEIQMADKPGSLGEVTKSLGDAGVNIKYVFVGPSTARKATVFLAVTDMASALKALR